MQIKKLKKLFIIGYWIKMFDIDSKLKAKIKETDGIKTISSIFVIENKLK